MVFMEFPGTAHYTLEWKRNSTFLTVGQHVAQSLALHTRDVLFHGPSATLSPFSLIPPRMGKCEGLHSREFRMQENTSSFQFKLSGCLTF